MQYITIVRGRLRDADQDAARDAHNAIVDALRPRSEPMGAVGHQAYADPQDPGSFVAIDRWSDMSGLQQFLGDPGVQQQLGSMFDGQPEVTVLAEREGWRAF
ncbi:MAG: putative quinol monooxygenase [Candidatus Limnocylindria bacterium]